jgi:CheY-like chemotaxis protein
MSTKKALVVDDDAINRKLIKATLTKEGFECVEASNGAEACNALKESGFDIILLDIKMPVMNGIEFLREIKLNPNYMNIPVIVLTTDDSKKTEALSMGANDIIIKPVNPVVLVEKIKTYV